MRESRSYGSVRGALSNERPYREFIMIWQWLTRTKQQKRRRRERRWRRSVATKAAREKELGRWRRANRHHKLRLLARITKRAECDRRGARDLTGNTDRESRIDCARVDHALCAKRSVTSEASWGRILLTAIGFIDENGGSIKQQQELKLGINYRFGAPLSLESNPNR